MFKKVEFINKVKEEDTVKIEKIRLIQLRDNPNLEGGIFIETGILTAEKIETRRNGNLKGISLFLPNNFDYELVIDDEGFKCLLVLKKEI